MIIAPSLGRGALASLSLLAIASSLTAQDQLVTQAIKKIAEAEAGLKTLADGDVAAANQLLGKLKWANKRLKAAYKKDTTHWKDAAERLAAADKAIRAKAASAAAKPKAEKPAEAKPPAGQPAKATEKPAATSSGPVIGEQFAKLQQLDKEVRNGFRNLQMLNKKFMGDAYRVGSITKEITKLQERLAAFPQDDKNVQIVAANLAKFANQFATWRAEYKADTDASAGLGAKIQAISAKYASEAVPGPIYWPYEREKLTTWAALTKKLLAEMPGDLATLRAAAPNALVGKKAQSTLRWIEGSIARRLTEQIREVRYAIDNYVRDSLQIAKDLRSIKLDDKHAITNRVLTEGALDRSMSFLQNGLEAVDFAAILDASLPPEAPVDRAAQRKEIEGTVGKLRELAKAALAEVRMPRPVSIDAKAFVELEKTARETLARKKYGVHEILSLVVTSDKARKEKTEGTISGTVTGARVTAYHYVWDQYNVVTAERVGDEVWMFHNLLKYYHKSDTVTPQGVWILSRRFQSTQILPENVEK